MIHALHGSKKKGQGSVKQDHKIEVALSVPDLSAPHEADLTSLPG